MQRLLAPGHEVDGGDRLGAPPKDAGRHAPQAPIEVDVLCGLVHVVKSVDPPVRSVSHPPPRDRIELQEIAVREVGGLGIWLFAQVEEREIRNRVGAVPESVERRDHRVDVGGIETVLDDDVPISNPLLEEARRIAVPMEAIQRVGLVEPG